MATIRLNSGHEMPVVGLGTWKSALGKVEAAVECAIDCGYRHIDCAYLYQNENEVGNAIKKKIEEGVVKREDLFITSKLWCTFHEPKRVKEGLMLSLKALQLDYLDLYLVHFPVGTNYRSATELFAVDENGKMKIDYNDIDYVETWKAMEKLVEEKLVRSIGISNYNEFQCKRLVKNCKIRPAVNQIEIHPYLVEDSLIRCCQELGISVTGFSPLVSGDRPWAGKDDPTIFEEPVMKQIAAKYKKSVAQIAIRFQVDRKLSVIPKSVTPERIKQNFEIFDFNLTQEDIKAISSLNKNFRAVHWSPVSPLPKYFPFQDNYTE